jgi:hypothetical protein
MLALTFLQMHCSFLAFDAWCFYHTPLGLRKATIFAEQAVHQSPWFSWICPKEMPFTISLFYSVSNICMFWNNNIYVFSIGLVGTTVQRFCVIRYAGCCTLLMQNVAPFYASKTNLSVANCRSTLSEISLQSLHSRLRNRLIPVVQRSSLEKAGANASGSGQQLRCMGSSVWWQLVLSLASARNGRTSMDGQQIGV